MVHENGGQNESIDNELYLYLHEKSIPEASEHLRNTWDNIMNDANHHLIVCEIDGKIVASCVCVIIPNLTRNVRPYAFVENVVTHMGRPLYERYGFVKMEDEMELKV